MHLLDCALYTTQHPVSISLHNKLQALWRVASKYTMWLSFSHSVVANSFQPHGLQHSRLPCPSLFPGVCSNSCPLSRWSHPTILSSCPLLLLPSVFIRVFSSESPLCIRWPKCWNLSFSIDPSDEYSGLIYFTIDWFDLLAVQGTLKSFLQHHNSKASILWHSVFFVVQLSHWYMTTWTIALNLCIYFIFFN